MQQYQLIIKQIQVFFLRSLRFTAKKSINFHVYQLVIAGILKSLFKIIYDCNQYISTKKGLTSYILLKRLYNFKLDVRFQFLFSFISAWDDRIEFKYVIDICLLFFVMIFINLYFSFFPLLNCQILMKTRMIFLTVKNLRLIERLNFRILRGVHK